MGVCGFLDEEREGVYGKIKGVVNLAEILSGVGANGVLLAAGVEDSEFLSFIAKGRFIFGLLANYALNFQFSCILLSLLCLLIGKGS